jgi:hypothetical protein
MNKMIKGFDNVSSMHVDSYINLNNQGGNRSQIDTLKPPSFALPCFVNPQTSLVAYYADYVSPHDSGFVTGNNVYGDLEKAQHYTNTASLTITGCAVLLNRVASSHTAIIGAKAKLYAFSSNHPTGTALDSSSLIKQDSLNNNSYTIFNFLKPMAVSSDFVVSIVLPSHNGDTMVVLSTYTTCNSGKSLSWERAVDNSWGTIHSNWNFANGADIDLAIFPLYNDSNTSIGNLNYPDNYLYFDNDLNLLKFSSLNGKNHLVIYDLPGRLVLDREVESKEINLSFLQQGYYIVSIDNGRQQLIKKIIKK